MPGRRGGGGRRPTPQVPVPPRPSPDAQKEPPKPYTPPPVVRPSPDTQDRLTTSRRRNVRRGASPSGGPGYREIRRTVQSRDVVSAQRTLRAAGFDIPVDGVWGPKTEAAWKMHVGTLRRGQEERVVFEQQQHRQRQQNWLKAFRQGTVKPNHKLEVELFGMEGAQEISRMRARAKALQTQLRIPEVRPLSGGLGVPTAEDIEERTRKAMEYQFELAVPEVKTAPKFYGNDVKVPPWMFFTPLALTERGRRGGLPLLQTLGVATAERPPGWERALLAATVLPFGRPFRAGKAAIAGLGALRQTGSVAAARGVAREAYHTPSLVPKVKRTIRILRGGPGRNIEVGIPAAGSRTGRLIEDFADNLFRPAASKVTKGIIKDPDTKQGLALERKLRLKEKIGTVSAQDLIHVGQKLKPEQEYTLRVILEGELPENRILFHQEQQAAAEADGFLDLAEYHKLHQDWLTKAKNFIDVDADGTMTLSRTAPPRLHKALELMREVTSQREETLTDLFLLSDEAMASRVHAPARVIRGARFQEFTTAIQNRLESSPVRASFFEWLDATQTPERARAAKMLFDAKIRRAAQDLHGDPMAVDELLNRLELGNYDEFVEGAPPGFKILYQDEWPEAPSMPDQLDYAGIHTALGEWSAQTGRPLPDNLDDVIESAYELAKIGGRWRDWYKRLAGVLADASEQLGVDPHTFAQVYAIYSQQANPTLNLRRAILATQEFQTTGKITLEIPKSRQAEKAMNVMNGGTWEGRKTNSYYANAMKYLDPEVYAKEFPGDEVTVDRHIARFFTGKVAPGRHYDGVEKTFQLMADELGWAPDEVQAAVWVPIKAENIRQSTIRKFGKAGNMERYLPSAADASERGLNAYKGVLFQEGSDDIDLGIASTLEDGGFTWNADGSAFEGIGYGASYEQYNVQIPRVNFTRENVESFWQAYGSLLQADPSLKVGSWYDAERETIHLDLTHVFDNVEDASRFAWDQNQDAIFDFERGIALFRPSEDDFNELGVYQVTHASFPDRLTDPQEVIMAAHQLLDQFENGRLRDELEVILSDMANEEATIDDLGDWLTHEVLSDEHLGTPDRDLLNILRNQLPPVEDRPAVYDMGDIIDLERDEIAFPRQDVEELIGEIMAHPSFDEGPELGGGYSWWEELRGAYYEDDGAKMLQMIRAALRDVSYMKLPDDIKPVYERLFKVLDEARDRPPGLSPQPGDLPFEESAEAFFLRVEGLLRGIDSPLIRDAEVALRDGRSEDAFAALREALEREDFDRAERQVIAQAMDEIRGDLGVRDIADEQNPEAELEVWNSVRDLANLVTDEEGANFLEQSATQIENGNFLGARRLILEWAHTLDAAGRMDAGDELAEAVGRYLDSVDKLQRERLDRLERNRAEGLSAQESYEREGLGATHETSRGPDTGMGPLAGASAAVRGAYRSGRAISEEHGFMRAIDAAVEEEDFEMAAALHRIITHGEQRFTENVEASRVMEHRVNEIDNEIERIMHMRPADEPLTEEEMAEVLRLTAQRDAATVEGTQRFDVPYHFLKEEGEGDVLFQTYEGGKVRSEFQNERKTVIKFTLHESDDPNSEKLGNLMVENVPDRGWEVTTIATNPRHYRKGVATRLWKEAKAALPDLKHSDTLTDEGKAWIQSLEGGAEHLSGRTSRGLEQRGGTLGGEPSPFGIKGAIVFPPGFDTQLANAIVALTDFSDLSTFAHEITHFIRRAGMSLETQEKLATWAGAEKVYAGTGSNRRLVDVIWDRDAEEKLARGMEEFLRRGIGPTGLKQEFKTLSKAMNEIYGDEPVTLAGKAIDLPPHIHDIFTEMVTPPRVTGGRIIGEEDLALGAARVPFTRGAPVGKTQLGKRVTTYFKIRRAMFGGGRGKAVGAGTQDAQLTHQFKGSLLLRGNFTPDVTKATAEDLILASRMSAIRKARQTLVEGGNELPLTEHDIAVKVDPRKDAPKELAALADELSSLEEAGVRLDAGVIGRAKELDPTAQQIHDLYLPGKIDGIDSRIVAAHAMEHKEPIDNIVWVSRNFMEGAGLLYSGPQKYTALKSLAKGFADTVNDTQRLFVLWLNPIYIPVNLMGNVVMNLMHQGVFAPYNLAKAVKMHWDMTPRQRLVVDAIMGKGLISSIAGARTRPAQLVTNPLTHAISTVVDLIPRRASFLHEARRQGYSQRRLNDLLDRGAKGEEEALEELTQIGLRANDAIVDYENLSQFEREVVSRVIFFYPWLKGASRWTYRYGMEHPVVSALLVAASDYALSNADEELGERPYYEYLTLPISTNSLGLKVPFTDIKTDLGKRIFGEHSWEDANGLPMTVNIRQALTPTTPLDIARAGVGYVTGDPEFPRTVEMLTPFLYGTGVSLYGFDPFHEQEVDQGARTFAAQYGDIPLKERWEKAMSHEIGGVTIPGTMSDEERKEYQKVAGKPRTQGQEIGRTFFGGLFPAPYNKDIQQERALEDRPLPVRREFALRRDAREVELEDLIDDEVIDQLKWRTKYDQATDREGMTAVEKLEEMGKIYAERTGDDSWIRDTTLPVSEAAAERRLEMLLDHLDPELAKLKSRIRKRKERLKEAQPVG